MFHNLSKESKDDIRKLLPKLNDKWRVATSMGMGVFGHDLGKNANLHISLVCLSDAFTRMELARDSLFNSYSCLRWYRKEWNRENLTTEEREFWSVRQGKYYTDYNLLILYAIGEDIADFILYFLSEEGNYNKWLNQKDIQVLLEKKRISSNAAKVGVFMSEKHKDNPITTSILNLKNNASWDRAMKYRNIWVHDKPPIVDGLGIEYERKSRIEAGDGYRQITFGGGAEPKHKIDELLKTSHEATEACSKVLSDLVEILITKRIELGEEIDFETGAISAKIM